MDVCEVHPSAVGSWCHVVKISRSDCTWPCYCAFLYKNSLASISWSPGTKDQGGRDSYLHLTNEKTYANDGAFSLHHGRTGSGTQVSWLPVSLQPGQQNRSYFTAWVYPAGIVVWVRVLRGLGTLALESGTWVQVLTILLPRFGLWFLHLYRVWMIAGKFLWFYVLCPWPLDPMLILPSFYLHLPYPIWILRCLWLFFLSKLLLKTSICTLPLNTGWHLLFYSSSFSWNIQFFPWALLRSSYRKSSDLWWQIGGGTWWLAKNRCHVLASSLM